MKKKSEIKKAKKNRCEGIYSCAKEMKEKEKITCCTTKDL